MFKIELGTGKNDGSPYIYKWGVECFGQMVEFSLSRKEFTDFKEKSKKFFLVRTKVKPYLEVLRNKINEKRGHKKEEPPKFQSKKSPNAEREAVV